MDTLRTLRRSTIVATFGLVAFVPGALHAQEETPGSEAIESAVRNVHAKMRQAAEALNAEALFAHVLQSATPPIIEDGRLALTRADALRRTTQGLQGIDSLRYTYASENITVLSQNTVLWVGTGSATATLRDGRRISAPFAETIVFVRRGDAWKVLHAHRSAPAE
jgi:hypothetical protein